MDRRTFLLASAGTLLAPPVWAGEAEPDEETLGVKDALAAPGPAPDAVRLGGEEFALLKRVHGRIARVRRTIGYGNFNLIGFDQMLAVARNYSRVGSFTRQELDFIEALFSSDASRYGFFGHKVFAELTAEVPTREVEKVPHTGHYVYRGRPMETYRRIQRDLGAENIVLTSGVRSLVKQLHLFLGKAVDTDGDLSLASRSLAPPGYSYHGIGDFDVGKTGFGYLNFTEAFAGTEEYLRLTQLGYVSIRYPKGNRDGVRFEPWHIRVV